MDLRTPFNFYVSKDEGTPFIDESKDFPLQSETD